MKYSVAIRTLGTSGNKYRTTLQSILSQSIKPEKVIVYIAEGYNIPKERMGFEDYVFVPKGMVAQRALRYEDINSEYILFLDDDVYLPIDAVEKLYQELEAYDADVIAPDVFKNHERDKTTALLMCLLGKSYARKNDDKWAYKALRNSGYSYNINPELPVYFSELNAGPCFFCRKETFISINFEDERWLDNSPYALPEDQVMFYKFHKYGYRILTSFDSGIIHLDAASTLSNQRKKEYKILYSESKNKLIYWHRFIYLPDRGYFHYTIINFASILMTNLMRILSFLLKFRIRKIMYWTKGIIDALAFINSIDYRKIPAIPTTTSYKLNNKE